MRRLISIAAFALVLTVPVWAQRGGGHGGGGGMRGGGFAGHVGGGHSMGGMHSTGMRSSPGSAHGFNHSTNHGGWHGSSWNHGSHSHGNHFHNCFGAFCGHAAFNSPWWGGGWGWGWGWGGYDPWMWSSWDEQDRRFNYEYDRQYELAYQWNQQSIAEQRMRDREEAEGEQDAYVPRSSNRASAPEVGSQPSEPAPATVLVFHDRRQQEVQNYAIVGQTLWAFSAGRTQKIPLASLDVAATEKANDDRGVAFRVPGVNEGQ